VIDAPGNWFIGLIDGVEAWYVRHFGNFLPKIKAVLDAANYCALHGGRYEFPDSFWRNSQPGRMPKLHRLHLDASFKDSSKPKLFQNTVSFRNSLEYFRNTTG
jgi:hypothetical protein